jgi:malonyl-CoA decarboxylase
LGFLELRRITWDAPASLLEKLAQYEAVHEVRSWLALKDRLDTDRRCFAYLHPAMPNEPLVFVEVALIDALPDRVAPLIDPKAPLGDAHRASVAAFYSISNCQRGLAGISLGNALIKGVATALAAEFPQLHTFTTLSPLPGFRAWLDAQAEQPGWGIESRALIENSGWTRDAAARDALERPLIRLCARYLLEARGRDDGAADPVERFHLSNGARLERICWFGDRSAKGLRESLGLMVNYVYRLDEIEANQEAYLSSGAIVASRAVRDLARESLETPRRKRAPATIKKTPAEV